MKERDRLAKIIWDYMLMRHELRPMDAVLALGSNDTRTAERAAELYNQGYGKYVICSGGHGKASRLTKTEAETFADILLQRGVPEEKIILEKQASNTGENIQFTKELLKEKGLHLNSFVLVQKPYMERRAYAAFRKQWPEVEVIVTSPQISFEEYGKNDENYKQRFIDVLVGDLQRIKEYPKLGFQIEQRIPPEVEEAWEELIKLGYTKYFLKP